MASQSNRKISNEQYSEARAVTMPTRCIYQLSQLACQLPSIISPRDIGIQYSEDYNEPPTGTVGVTCTKPWKILIR